MEAELPHLLVFTYTYFPTTVNTEIFVRILFLPKALKDIFATLNNVTMA